jgi:hypothetical protein
MSYDFAIQRRTKQVYRRFERVAARAAGEGGRRKQRFFEKKRARNF